MSPFRAQRLHRALGALRLALDDGVATVTFNRPERLNALTFEVYADLRDLARRAPHRDDVRVLVITGTGRGFCSGGDVEEIIGELQEMAAARAARLHPHDGLGRRSACASARCR